MLGILTSTILSTNTGQTRRINILISCVHVTCKRCGGAYGGKIIRASANSTACAVAAYVTNRPVRLRMNFKTNMEMVGKRFPYLAKYKVGVTSEGLLKAVDLTYYTACGNATNE
ncbi:xanthine dehydrogenase-like, partial [Paramuricea clavata]